MVRQQPTGRFEGICMLCIASCLQHTVHTYHLWEVPMHRCRRDNVLQGQQDFHLTELGVQQARLVAARLRDINFFSAYTSDLTRATRTAELILEHHERVTLTKSKGLREYNLGVLEGLPRGTKRSEASRIKAAQQGVPLSEFVGGRIESPQEMLQRCQDFMKEMVNSVSASARNTADGKVEHGIPVLCVSHGGFIHTLLECVFCLGPMPLPGNCSITVVEVRERSGTGDLSFRCCLLNDVSHITGAGLSTNSTVENLVP
ncbi:unnamed protein product [Discosporangium mesarthrocarpum]